MIVSINQPAYLPWLGYFDRIIKSDVHVVLDHVQFEKNSMVNRNKIRTHQGNTMLTVPVLTKGKFQDLSINTLEIDVRQPWRKKHWKAIQQNYSKAPFFKEYAPFLEDLYSKEWSDLLSIVKALNGFVINALNVQTKIIYSSDMNIEGEKSDLVLNICKSLDAKTYLSGPFGRDYLDRPSFDDAGISLEFHDYDHPKYAQMHGDFEPYMCIFDLLFNQGPDSHLVFKR